MKLLSFLLFNFSFFVARIAVKSETTNSKKSTFGDVSEETDVSVVEPQTGFSNFLKTPKKGIILKLVGENYIGFSEENAINIFNIKNNQHTVIKFKDMNRTDKIHCFCCDSKYIYVKFRKYIRVFDHGGNEIASYNFKNNEYYGMDLYVDNNRFYLVSHNKEILGFRFDAPMRKINLIFYNNDFYSSKLGNFRFVLGQDLYILNGKRLAVIHKLSGKVLKNNYLDYLFDNMVLLKNSVFLYGKKKFISMKLSDFSMVYNNNIDLFKSPIVIDSNILKFGKKTYDGIYLYNYFFKNLFFRYSQNTYDSRCFLIKKGKVFEFILRDFAISHVFYSNNTLILVDIKSKKIKLV
ncbi:hypothetical protein [Alphaproteobacteria bacterium endosymbiont of Tiliacea citrago]|uniref:hypothetical protein n=1 Tax=Alphaproteobacteria bacterium endosymbiont of Tiliacea citrago TaxID=3077944 RepID=UPI00313AC44F